MPSIKKYNPLKKNNPQMNILDLIKFKHICFSKDNVKRMKSVATDWEKIFSHHISDRSLESRIHKNSQNSIISKPTTNAKDLNRELIKEDIFKK